MCAQDYKCHKSNGVVLCFCNDRVFASCMDVECRRALSLHRNAYYVMARELEEDIFARKSSTAAAAESSPDAYKTSAARQNSSTAVGSSMSVQSYKLSAEYVQSVLSPSQTNFLNSIRKQKQDLLDAYHHQALSQQQQTHAQTQTHSRLHLRKFCKVPWRNMYVSTNCTRTWVEITEPVMKAYVAWVVGRSGANNTAAADDNIDAKADNVSSTVPDRHGSSSTNESSSSLPPSPSREHKRIKTAGFNQFLSLGCSAAEQRESVAESKAGADGDGACGSGGATQHQQQTKRRKQAYFFDPFV